MTGPDPATDDAVRWRAHHALNMVLATARDVLARRSDRTGAYEVPDPIGTGDVSGLIRSGEVSVLDRLQEAIDAARQANDEIRARVDAYQRERYGGHWNPPGSTPPETPATGQAAA